MEVRPGRDDDADETAAEVLLVDNHDSFSWNVAALLRQVTGRPPVVWRNDHLVDPEELAQQLRRFAAIVVGPGPGRPQRPADLGLSRLALEQQQVPVLGLCLGHQGLAHLAGAEVRELAEPMHGRVSTVRHDGTGVFTDVPSPLQAVRYHSLEVALPAGSDLRATAWAEDDGCVMALEDRSGRRAGVQFHPESVLSEHGEQVVANFLAAAGVPSVRRGTGGSVATGDVPRPARGGHRPRYRVRVRARTCHGAVDPWALHEHLVAGADSSVWLDSSAGEAAERQPPANARFSVVADDRGPRARRISHRVGVGTSVRSGDGETLLPGPLLDNLRTLLGDWELVEDVQLPTPFRPGLLGYLGYELKAETGGEAAHRSELPDAWWVLADRAVVLDHHTDTVYALYLTDETVAAEQERWAAEVERLVDSGVVARRSAPGPVPPSPGASEAAGEGRHTEQEYRRLIARCQELIRAGESYEICLTTMVRWPAPVAADRLARALRRASPAPFGAWLRAPGLDVVGSSPERFLSVSPHGQVQARPIKGTRRRDADPVRDAALAHELAEAVKDRAENLMIVDLLRHDLHRVCRAGSVHVPQLFAVESHPAVHQLVSTVEGQLAEGMGALDVVASCFPGGSMTGAPKERTMQILDTLEGAARGVYAGALGWIGLNGAADLSIVIRTATVVGRTASFGVGGAITALSDPEEELAEVRHKGRALTAALNAAATGTPESGPGRN